MREGDSVLDMCAAPGGKSIVLANALNATGHMIANEISNDRRERMLNVFRQYLLEERRMRVHIKGKDAARFGLEMPGQFDRILLDAPCSSERHIMHQGKNKSSLDWTLKQAQRNSTRQYSLACAALLGACSKGRIVYATCSINPMENDDVMAKLEKKKSDTFRFITELSTEVLPGIEKTKYGWQYLPDQSGLGPLYFSVLEKI